MADESSTREMIERALSGSKADLEQLLRGVQGLVHGLALRMLRDRETARDATQEILIRVATRLDSFRNESSFTTWVYRVGANHLLNLRRQQSEWPTVDFETAADQLDAGLAAMAGQVPSDDPILINQVGVFCTQGMLLCLDRDLRLAYTLGEILELSGEEAAAVLDIEPQVFRKRLSRARALLYSFLRARCGLVEEAADCRCEKLAEFLATPERFPIPADRAKRRLPQLPGEAELEADVRQLQVAARMFRQLAPKANGEDLVAAIRGAISGAL